MIVRANTAQSWPLADQSVQTIVTSPPYWGLRDYGVSGQLGSEATFQAYIEAMVGVFAEAWRVLRDDGTLWLNLGDCYATGSGARGDWGKHAYTGEGDGVPANRMPQAGLKAKDLVGLPWRIAFALQAAGWWLRMDIVWHKPNPMPESVTDRPTRAHEYVFLLTKGPKYFYDHEAIKERVSGSAHARGAGVTPKARTVSKTSRVNVSRVGRPPQPRNNESFSAAVRGLVDTRNKRSVWTVATCGAMDGEGIAHFAAFPPELIKPCILAGCPKGGVVLDPFGGTGTTVRVAQALGRRGIAMELNGDYARLAQRNLSRGIELVADAMAPALVAEQQLTFDGDAA